jgi:hypothetical protein
VTTLRVLPPAFALALLACAGQAAGQSATPSPRPTGLQIRFEAHSTFVTQTTNGPGTQPPEGAGFAAGSPASPLTPYDTLSGSPLLPGNAGEAGMRLTPTLYARGWDLGLVLDAGYVRGSVANAIYWGEPLTPALDPHLGSQMLPAHIAFPTHAGQDEGAGFVAGVESGRIATSDGHFALRAGWFDPVQSDRFAFIEPLLSQQPPVLAALPPESLGDGSPSLDWWSPANNGYRLHGLDFTGKVGLATVELSDASLPSLPGTGARLTMGSLVIDHGEGTRYSLQALHVATGGAPVATTILFGQGALLATPQGMLPSTTIGGQRQTILSARGAFHVIRNLDGVLEYGHSTYDADGVMLPGTGKPGNYYHGGFSDHFGRATVSLDLYRNEPYYAQAILPYGTPENVWSVAWSWPGQWLKSNYQLIDDTAVNINRQGYRVKYALKGGPLEVRAQYANFGQIEPISVSNARQTGFVDGFFLPQADAFATLGRQHQYGLWVAWHPSFADLVFDYTEDMMRRPAAPSQPQDLVSYDAPVFSFYAVRHVSPNVLVSAGLARYYMRGSFGQAFTNIDFGQRQLFAGAEVREAGNTATLFTWRRALFGGFPSMPGGPSPDFGGTLFVIEQRFKT